MEGSPVVVHVEGLTGTLIALSDSVRLVVLGPTESSKGCEVCGVRYRKVIWEVCKYVEQMAQGLEIWSCLRSAVEVDINNTSD